ncbi:BACON domain-containing protein [Azohydromonas lata]|uniref:BACON domain-containing protein n=1 Tax=Azohydromonas lata TaxID=45677 RepID=UPI000AE0CCBA|nr:hypothetical protein [Azohydromonas lata]
MTLSPSLLSSNFQTGTSATLTVRATATDSSVFDTAVFAYVVDSQHVLTSSVELAQLDSKTYSTTLHSSASIRSGHHTGTLQVKLCKDANCTSQYPGSPLSLPYDFTVTAAPLSVGATASTAATVHRGATVSQAVPVSVSGPELPWTATANASWLRVSGGSGTKPGSFTVGYDATGLAEAEYASTVTVRSSDGQTAEVPFSLTVLPTQFTMTGGVPTFTAINGAPIPAQELAFELDSKVASPWTATTSAAWLVASPLSGTTPGLITLQPDPSRGPLASGTHAANIVLSSPGVINKTVTTGLSLARASLSSAADAVTLGGPKGRDLTSAAALNVSLNTGAKAWPFSLSPLPAWLSSTTKAGSVAAAGTSLSFAPNAAGATPGSVTSTVTMTATVNGDTVTRPVTVNLNADQRRLLVSEWGVAFASTPTGSVLTRTVMITDNFKGNAVGNWSWSSDSVWLTASSSGGTNLPTQLTLIADPSSLATGSVSYANVTVSAPGVEAAVIRVALYKDATGLTSMVKLPQDYAELIADKIRPHVYAHRGGTSIDVYNAYTAQKIATLSGVGAALGKMAVSPDGSKLFVLDTAVRSLKVVDLSTKDITSWPLVNGVSTSTTLLAIRPNGVEVVLVGDGTAYAAGRSLGVTDIVESLAASSDGRKVYTQNRGISPASIAAYDVDYSAMAGGVLIVAKTADGWFVNGSSNGRDIAVSGDASRLYVASGAPYACTSVDPTSLAFVGSLPGGDAYPNNVEVTRDGRVICGISGWYSSGDFWVHSPAGALLGRYKIAGYAREMKESQMVVTPDGLVVVALTDDPVMAFVPIGP